MPWEYGGFNVTAMDAHGGWITTAKDLLKLLVSVDSFTTKPDMLKPATIHVMVTPSANNQYYAKGWSVNPYNNWWHTGSLDGTASEQVRAANGYSWAIILNKRIIDNNANQFATDLDNLGWNCINNTSSWPEGDYMLDPTVNASGIQFSNVSTTSLKVSFKKGNGSKRLLIVGEDSALTSFPLDGTDYTGAAAFGTGSQFGKNYAVYNDAGSSITVTGLTKGTKYYFRVVEYNKIAASDNKALYLLGNNPQTAQTTLTTLPVTLAYFNAEKVKDNSVNLTWQTAQEINSAYFNIERSGDGQMYTTIGKLDATGGSTAENYTFTDALPLLQSTNYYRLKMVDKNGAFAYSAIRAIEFGSGSFSLTPNPANNAFSINGYNGKQAQVIDINGKTVLNQVLKTGTNNIGTTQLPNGVYLVKIIGANNKTEVHRLLVAH